MANGAKDDYINYNRFHRQGLD